MNAEQLIVLIIFALLFFLGAFCIFIAPFMISSKCSRQEEAEQAEQRSKKQ